MSQNAYPYGQKFVPKKNLKDWTKWNRQWVVEVSTSQVVLSWTQLFSGSVVQWFSGWFSACFSGSVVQWLVQWFSDSVVGSVDGSVVQ